MHSPVLGVPPREPWPLPHKALSPPEQTDEEGSTGRYSYPHHYIAVTAPACVISRIVGI